MKEAGMNCASAWRHFCVFGAIFACERARDLLQGGEALLVAACRVHAANLWVTGTLVGRCGVMEWVAAAES